MTWSYSPDLHSGWSGLWKQVIPVIPVMPTPGILRYQLRARRSELIAMRRQFSNRQKRRPTRLHPHFTSRYPLHLS